MTYHDYAAVPASERIANGHRCFVVDEVEVSIANGVECRDAIDHQIAFARCSDRTAYLLFVKSGANQRQIPSLSRRV